MKKFTILLLTFFAALALAPLASAQSESDRNLYVDAVSDFKSARYEEAVQKFAILVRKYPKDAKLRYYLNNSRLRLIDNQVPKGTVEAELSQVVLPKFQVQGASLDLVFDYLSAKATELSDGKVKANFIYKGTQDERERQNISLNLTNIPITEVIRYVGEITGTHFDYEKHAIVATPRANLAVPAGQADTKPANKDPFAPKQSGDPFDPFA